MVAVFDGDFPHSLLFLPPVVYSPSSGTCRCVIITHHHSILLLTFISTGIAIGHDDQAVKTDNISYTSRHHRGSPRKRPGCAYGSVNRHAGDIMGFSTLCIPFVRTEQYPNLPEDHIFRLNGGSAHADFCSALR